MLKLTQMLKRNGLKKKCILKQIRFFKIFINIIKYIHQQYMVFSKYTDSNW